MPWEELEMATKQKETIQKRNTVDTVAKYFLLIADVLLLLFFGISRARKTPST